VSDGVDGQRLATAARLASQLGNDPEAADHATTARSAADTDAMMVLSIDSD
jgi:hypothetical protein